MRLAEPHSVARFDVHAGSRAVGHTIRELPLADRTWVETGLERDGRTRPVRGSTVLEPGDRLRVITDLGDVEALRKLFRLLKRRLLRRPCGHARLEPSVVRRSGGRSSRTHPSRSASSSHSRQTTCSLPAPSARQCSKASPTSIAAPAEVTGNHGSRVRRERDDTCYPGLRAGTQRNVASPSGSWIVSSSSRTTSRPVACTSRRVTPGS